MYSPFIPVTFKIVVNVYWKQGNVLSKNYRVQPFCVCICSGVVLLDEVAFHFQETIHFPKYKV